MIEFRKNRRAILSVGLLLLVGVVTAIVIGVWPANHTYKIPKDIRSRLAFPVLFLQEPSSFFKLESNSIKYSQADGTTPVFSFLIDEGQANRVTFTEQAYPEVLVYDSLVNGIGPYAEVGTLYGKASLGRPKDSGGKQVAVLKYGDSTLVFAKPAADLSNQSWTALFNSLGQVK